MVDIEQLAKEAGFSKDKYGLYWDCDANAEGVDLEEFANLVRKSLASDIIARLEAGFGATSSAPLIIKREFLNETSHTG